MQSEAQHQVLHQSTTQSPALYARTLAVVDVVHWFGKRLLRLRVLRLAVRAIAQASSSPNNAFLAVLTARTPSSPARRGLTAPDHSLQSFFCIWFWG